MAKKAENRKKWQWRQYLAKAANWWRKRNQPVSAAYQPESNMA
jgi:hypothetical protein